MSPTSTPPGPTPEHDLLPTPESPENGDREPASSDLAAEPAPLVPTDPDAPLTFIPHTPEGAVGNQPVRIRTGRYGVLEEHELVRLLDTIEDERARSRFRESIYISVFVWLAVAGLVLFGPRYIWHAPRVRNVGDVLKEQQMTSLSMPPAPRLAPVPPPHLNNRQLDQLRTMTREAARRTPTPERTPSPATPPPANLPNAPTPAADLPKPPPPTVTPQPSPRLPQPVADAPTPQTPSRPNFNTGSNLPGQDIQKAIDNVAHSRGGGGDYSSGAPGRGTPVGAGAEILSPTDGVDFGPYIKRILADIRRNWIPLLPEETRPPLLKQGEDQIRFKIGPDGTILAMVPEGSTHDGAIDRSCWSAITSENQFPPLPKEFHGPNLELRLHFFVNEKPE